MREVPRAPVKTENWLLTFNDMMTLVFTFFVLILSFSSMQSSEILLATESFKKTLTPGKTEGVFRSIISPVVSPYRDRDIEIERQKKAVTSQGDGKAGKLKLSMLVVVGGVDRLTVDQIRNDITINMEEATLFKPDTNHLNNRGEQILSSIADKIRDDKVDIRIECFDKKERSGGLSQGEANLSMFRAGTIARYLIEQGRLQPQRLSAMGYGALKDETKHGIKIILRS